MVRNLYQYVSCSKTHPGINHQMSKSTITPQDSSKVWTVQWDPRSNRKNGVPRGTASDGKVNSYVETVEMHYVSAVFDRFRLFGGCYRQKKNFTSEIRRDFELVDSTPGRIYFFPLHSWNLLWVSWLSLARIWFWTRWITRHLGLTSCNRISWQCDQKNPKITRNSCKWVHHCYLSCTALTPANAQALHRRETRSPSSVRLWTKLMVSELCLQVFHLFTCVIMVITGHWNCTHKKNAHGTHYIQLIEAGETNRVISICTVVSIFTSGK